MGHIIGVGGGVADLEHSEHGRHCLAHGRIFRFRVDLKQRDQLATAPLGDVKARLLPTRQTHGSQHWWMVDDE